MRNLASGGMRPIRLSPFSTSELRPPDRGGGRRVRPGEAGLAERPSRHPTVNTEKYPAAALFLVLAAAVLAPFVFAPLGSTVLKMTSVANPAADRASTETSLLGGGVGANSAPQVVRNATNLIADGTFDAIPGPWIYTNGTTGAVTASRDPQARARLGHTTPILRFDSMDNIFGANRWTPVVSNAPASSNLSQETTIRIEGNGSMRDDVTINQNNQWAGAFRDDPLPWNWSGYDRLAIWMNKATPGTLWGWVYVQDQAGANSWGLFSLVSGWYGCPMDLRAPLILAQINYIEIAFASTGATSGTIYIDDLVLFNSTTFAESAHVAQTFTKSIPTGASANSLRLVFDLQATPPANVLASLEVTIGNRVAWSGPPAAGMQTIEVDLSGDAALQATGSFSLAFSLQLNRTGWEEPSMTTWIDNVTLVIPGTLARIAVTPTTASVLVDQSAVFTAGGWDTDGNPVPLTATNWSSTIGQIVSANDTSASFRAPTQPGTGIVTATQGTISGTANVTVDPPTAGVPPSSPWDSMIWPGLAFLAGILGIAGFVALRASARHAFRIEDLFLINREGLLIAHTTSRRDSHGDEDILAGMLTAIMSFAQDVFQEEIGGLRQFAIGNKTVALEPSQHVYVAAIGSGSIRNRLSTSLRDFLADIEERYGDRLQWWSGMNEDLLGIDAMVQLFARRERYRRGDWKRHASPLTESEQAEKLAGAVSEVHFVIVPKEPLRPL